MKSLRFASITDLIGANRVENADYISNAFMGGNTFAGISFPL